MSQASHVISHPLILGSTSKYRRELLQRLGAQAVGMSTVPETILARHAGLRVLGFSLMTNMAAGMEAEVLSHAHTMATAQSASQRAVATLSVVVQALEL